MSKFPAGVIGERIHLVTGLFQTPHLAEFDVQDVPVEPPQVGPARSHSATY